MHQPSGESSNDLRSRRRYSAFYHDRHDHIIYRLKPNDGSLEDLPDDAVPIQHPGTTYYRADGGDKLEFAVFATKAGRKIIVMEIKYD